jgi:hypothetical protein
MSLLDHKAQQREELAHKRGWILYLLFLKRPAPLSAARLWKMLDKQNVYFSRRTLAEELDYLRSLRLIDVFPQGSTKKLDDVEQTMLIQRYIECQSDEEMGVVMCARIRERGIDFQLGETDHAGITRVE